MIHMVQEKELWITRGNSVTVYKKTVRPTDTNDMGYSVLETKAEKSVIEAVHMDGSMDVWMDGKLASVDKNGFIR